MDDELCLRHMRDHAAKALALAFLLALLRLPRIRLGQRLQLRAELEVGGAKALEQALLRRAFGGIAGQYGDGPVVLLAWIAHVARRGRAITALLSQRADHHAQAEANHDGHQGPDPSRHIVHHIEAPSPGCANFHIQRWI